MVVVVGKDLAVVIVSVLTLGVDAINIVVIICKKIGNGHGYEPNFSVYFNTIKFSKQRVDIKLE